MLIVTVSVSLNHILQHVFNNSRTAQDRESSQLIRRIKQLFLLTLNLMFVARCRSDRYYIQ